MTFAYGTHALAICERCGFQIKYLELTTEWNGTRVCDSCFEEKHPQLDPSPVSADAEALYKPSPERRQALEVFTGRVFPPLENTIYHAMGLVGQVTADAVIQPVFEFVSLTGVGGTASVGTATVTAVAVASASVTGLAGTMSVGTPTVSVGGGMTVTISAAAGSTASGGAATVVAKANVTISAAAGSTASGGSVTTVGKANVTISGAAGSTGSVGTVTVNVPSGVTVTISGAAGSTASVGTATVVAKAVVTLYSTVIPLTWSTTDKESAIVVSNGNLTATNASTDHNAVIRAIKSLSRGKWHWESTVGAAALDGNGSPAGIALSSAVLSTYLGDQDDSLGWYPDGSVYINEIVVSTVGTYVAGNRLVIEYDADAKLIWLAVGAGNWNNSGTANPATGTEGISTAAIIGDPVFPAAGLYKSTDSVTLHSDAATFTRAVSSGFAAYATVSGAAGKVGAVTKSP
jgi:hypothetical protein